MLLLLLTDVLLGHPPKCLAEHIVECELDELYPITSWVSWDTQLERKGREGEGEQLILLVSSLSMMHPNKVASRFAIVSSYFQYTYFQYLLLLFIIVALQRDRWHCTSLSFKIFLHAKVASGKWVEWIKRVSWNTQVEWTCRKFPRLWCSTCQLLLLLLLALCSLLLFNGSSVSFLFGFGKRWPRLLPKYSWLLSSVNHALIEQFSKSFCIQIYIQYIYLCLAHSTNSS